jgi:hypothetical protein
MLVHYNQVFAVALISYSRLRTAAGFINPHVSLEYTS